MILKKYQMFCINKTVHDITAHFVIEGVFDLYFLHDFFQGDFTLSLAHD